MSTKAAVGTLVIAGIIIVGFVFLRGESQAPTDTELPGSLTGENMGNEPQDTSANETQNEQAQTHIVAYTDSGYSPGSITINAGDTVTWQNQSSRGMWTASAVHPTHRVYPGTDITQCESADDGSMFDACRMVPAGQSWSFTFTQAGTWRYHNHVQASHTGTVIVQ